MTKLDFIQTLQSSARDPRLNAVLDNALRLITDSPTFRWASHSDQPEYRFDAQHYVLLYSSRLERQRKRGWLSDGIEESVGAFRDARGPLAGCLAEIEGRMVCVWLDKTPKIVGCMFGVWKLS